jgi:hypothetical protein
MPCLKSARAAKAKRANPDAARLYTELAVLISARPLLLLEKWRGCLRPFRRAGV